MTSPNGAPDPKLASGEPRPAGGEPRPEGGEPRPEGGEPRRPAGGESRAAGGEPRQPAGRLARPPSDRYGHPPNEGASTAPTRTARSLGRTLAPAILAAVVTTALIVLLGGVLAEQRGLLALAGIGGAVVGLLAAEGATSPDGVTPAVMSRGTTRRIAVGLAVAMIVVAAFAMWLYSRFEGGVMDPLGYLWATFGLFVPAQVVIAAVAAAWGAGAGPVRWNQ